MGALVMLLALSVRHIKKNLSSWNQFVARQALISIFCIAVMELSDFHLRIPSIALLFVLQLALLVHSSYDSVRDSFTPNVMQAKPPPRGFKWLFAFACLSVGTYLFVYSTNAD